MNIKEQLLQTHSKENTRKVTDYIGTDEKLLAELMHCFFSNTYRVTQRSAMAVSDCFDRHPEMMEPYKSDMIDNLKNEPIHVAVKRNTIRILQFTTIPQDKEAELFDLCYSYVKDQNEPIAVKAFSMTILLNICKKYPELKTELMPLIQQTLERNDSAGIKHRASNVLKHLISL